MSFLSGLFGGGKNPADAGMPYLDQIPGATQPYYQPYIDQGRQAGKNLTGQYDQMTQNPGEFYNNLGKGYKESPGYQFKLQQALQSANNASAAGGMAGSAQHQQFATQIGNDVANQDYQEYINHMMNIFGQGQQGQQKFQEQGFNASQGYGNIVGDTLGRKAQLGYEGQASRNANQSGLFGNIAGVASSFIPGLNFLGNKPWKNPGAEPGWE